MGFKVEEKFRIILVMKEVNLTNGTQLCAALRCACGKVAYRCCYGQ